MEDLAVRERERADPRQVPRPLIELGGWDRRHLAEVVGRPFKSCSSVKETPKSKLKSLPAEETNGVRQPIRQRNAASGVSRN